MSIPEYKVGSWLNSLEAGGNVAFARLSQKEQAWVQTEAHALVSKEHFGPADLQRLKQSAAALFPGADSAALVAVVRFRALRSAAGGNINRLATNRGGITAFQQQLLNGGGASDPHKWTWSQPKLGEWTW